MKNKKGEKYLSIYWFAILGIVVVGIVAMVFVFYGEPYDVRAVENEILIMKISDCLFEGNLLRDDITNENVLEKCNLILDDEYYFEIENLGIVQGNSNLKDYCGRGDSVVCVEKNVFYVRTDGSGETIKILSGVRKDA